MAKTYKEYMAEAVRREPGLYGGRYNIDGSPKPLPKMSPSYKRGPKYTLEKELSKLPKNGYIPKPKKPELQISGTEIRVKGRKLNLAILEMPKNPTRKEYNKVWMHNSRVRQKIKMLKEKYGTTISL